MRWLWSKFWLFAFCTFIADNSDERLGALAPIFVIGFFYLVLVTAKEIVEAKRAQRGEIQN
jgi:hypothetical protein